MTTSTMPDSKMEAELKGMRAKLHQRLRDRPKLEAQVKEALTELNEAIRAEESFERPRGYKEQFENKFAGLSRAMSELDNEVKQQLRNGCQDPELRREYHDTRTAKQSASRDHSDAQAAFETATQRLTEWRTRLERGYQGETRGFGEPAILKDGDALPWPTNSIVRAGLRIIEATQGHEEKKVLWAIFGDRIEFRPGTVQAEDLEKYYKREWFERYRAVENSSRAMNAAAERLKVASEALDEVREKLVWSPV